MPSALLNTLLSRLRTDLQDASAALWSDAELTDHVSHAVREFSLAIPRERRSTLATTAGSRTIDLSSLTDLIEVVAVEWPIGKFPKVYQPFSYFAGALELTGPDLPDGTTCTIYWLSPHILDNTTSTIPLQLEDLILLGAGAFALLDQASQTINQVNTGGQQAGAAYRRLGDERLAEFRRQLARRGRSGSVRLSRLYTPALPRPAQSTDPGP